MSAAELLEALDDNGQPIGQRKTWLSVLKDGDWRNVVHVWIVNHDGQLLVQRRSATHGSWNDKWDVSMGGTVSAGEKPEQSALRELQEELGLKVKDEHLKKLGVWNVKKNIPERDNHESKEFSHDYLLIRDLDIKSLILQKNEVRQVAWKSLREMRGQIEDDKLYKNWVPHPKKYYFEVIDLIEETLRQ